MLFYTAVYYDCHQFMLKLKKKTKRISMSCVTFLGERYCVPFALCYEPSVRLSVVCNVVAPCSELWTFPQYFAPPNSLGTQYVLKFLAKKWMGCRWPCNLMIKNYFSTNISLYFENGKKYGHIYNERRIGTLSIEWCHFQWPWTTRNPDFIHVFVVSS